MKENRHAAKGSLLVEKQKDFSIQKCVDSQPETKIESGRLVSHRAQSTELQNFMAAKLKGNFFVLLRHKSPYRRKKKNSVNFVGT